MKTVSRLQYFTQENLLFTYEEQVKLISSCGCDYVHLKIKNSNEEAYLKIAQKCVKIAHENNSKLIVWDYPEVAKKVHADGVHFTEWNSSWLNFLKKFKDEYIFGCSVNSLDDVIGLKYEFDYLFLGPYENRNAESDTSTIIGITGYKILVDEIFEILDQFKSEKLFGIFHCFTGSIKQANKAIGLNFKLGIGGVVTYKNGRIDQFIKKLPLESIVLETDSPYLSPTPLRGKRNESSHLTMILKKVSDCFNISVEEIARITTKNAMEVFKKVDFK